MCRSANICHHFFSELCSVSVWSYSLCFVNWKIIDAKFIISQVGIISEIYGVIELIVSPRQQTVIVQIMQPTPKSLLRKVYYLPSDPILDLAY